MRPDYEPDKGICPKCGVGCRIDWHNGVPTYFATDAELLAGAAIHSDETRRELRRLQDLCEKHGIRT